MTRRMLGLPILASALITASVIIASAWADERCDQRTAVARLVSVQGRIELNREPAAADAWICPGDTVRVAARSRAAVLLIATETVLRLDQESVLRVSEPPRERQSFLDLVRGVMHIFSHEPRRLDVRTPFVNAAVEGTEFLIRAERDHAAVQVFEGRVVADNEQGRLELAGNEAALIEAGEAPRRVAVVRPLDAVQWALYYQPVLAALQKTMITPGYSNLNEIFVRLDRVPEAERDKHFYVDRAGLLLSVGRVEEARVDIERVLAIAPGEAEALALSSIIAVTQNDKAAALDLALKATNNDPESAAAHIALSYARQAHFDVQGALLSLWEAVAHDPDNALAWARLAELRLATGDLEEALEAARKAVQLSPNLARTQTVLGFAYLTQIKTGQAQEALKKAIELDQAAPLPRLGLGLARIREGELEAGRTDVEIAVSLDPANSLFRSYLGKAFYEEKRDRLAATQYGLAKELDPFDPTPWFYDAIRKQTVNRPVEALRDLQKAIELNDNRAVYRSRLLLDQDLAARSASLGQVYRDLGFEQLALVEGWKSVNIDPSDYSGHRLLADTYSTLPRHEIARDSELLQAQLLQPLNLNPVQPRLADNGLRFLDELGTSDLGLNEFFGLFARNDLRLRFDGVVGNNSTIGDNLILSGVYNRFSYSIGQFHFESEGIRENNDLNQDIYNAFFQVVLSHNTSVQAEFRKVEEEFGDPGFFFDPENFETVSRTEIDRRSIRFGFRHDFSPNSTLIGSCVKRNLDFVDDFGPGSSDVDFIELRYLYNRPYWKHIAILMEYWLSY